MLLETHHVFFRRQQPASPIPDGVPPPLHGPRPAAGNPPAFPPLPVFRRAATGSPHQLAPPPVLGTGPAGGPGVTPTTARVQARGVCGGVGAATTRRAPAGDRAPRGLDTRVAAWEHRAVAGPRPCPSQSGEPFVPDLDVSAYSTDYAQLSDRYDAQQQVLRVAQEDLESLRRDLDMIRTERDNALQQVQRSAAAQRQAEAVKLNGFIRSLPPLLSIATRLRSLQSTPPAFANAVRSAVPASVELPPPGSPQFLARVDAVNSVELSGGVSWAERRVPPPQTATSGAGTGRPQPPSAAVGAHARAPWRELLGELI